jgi:hypothetical protein
MDRQHDDAWPVDLDDLRRHPGRLVSLHHLVKLGLVQSARTEAKAKKRALRFRHAPYMWEARTVLELIGAKTFPGCKPGSKGKEMR